MYIVCYTIQRENKDYPNETQYYSNWLVHDTLEEAREEYNKLFHRKGLFSATICKPIESTEPHYIKEASA